MTRELDIAAIEKRAAAARKFQLEYDETRASADDVPALLADRAELVEALEVIAELGGRTLLGPEWDTERHHEMGAAKAFEQAADFARRALDRARGGS